MNYKKAAMNYRTEKDSLGEVQVPVDKYWGAQTQRSMLNFQIGPPHSMPIDIIHAFGYLKKACAMANYKFGILSHEKLKLISEACDEIIAGRLDSQFPLVIWQTGSGTHTNMNCNEVISYRAQVLQSDKTGEGTLFIHPNDDVNMSQSSNDTFPTAMHIAAYKLLVEKTIPAIGLLENTFWQKSITFANVVKIGRTHLMDATPITLGQEFSGYASQLQHGLKALRNSLGHLSELALGGTAVGTGLNAPEGFDVEVAAIISRLTGLPFKTAANKFESLASNDAMVETHAALKQLAVSLMKIANDIRLSASGPRSGIGELMIPANEPGSSIMPGKINPTQAEALTMVCARVMGNDTTISVAGSNGHFELNVFKPVMASTLLESAALLADACRSFNNHCVVGIEPNMNRINTNLQNSLMLVTALNPHIGYDKAAQIAKKAHADNLSLKAAALKLGFMTEEEFDEWVVPEEMTKTMK
ncbi:MAG TPA: class II fumarate hydratase [Paludibacter sp.]|nr:class II fumarate hydratase [Paludibacter sp.]